MIEFTEAATKQLLGSIDPGDYIRIGIRYSTGHHGSGIRLIF